MIVPIGDASVFSFVVRAEIPVSTTVVSCDCFVVREDTLVSILANSVFKAEYNDTISLSPNSKVDIKGILNKSYHST